MLNNTYNGVQAEFFNCDRSRGGVVLGPGQFRKNSYKEGGQEAKNSRSELKKA